MAVKLFKDVTPYRLTQDIEPFQKGEEDVLNHCLSQRPSREPASTELGTFGFLEPAGEEDQFVEVLSNGALLIRARQLLRDLPAAVVNREVNKRVRKIEDDEQRKVYGKERRQIKDEVILSLLPRAFVKEKHVSALIMPPYIFVDTASAKTAETLLSTLREVIGSLPIRPVTMKTSPVLVMTDFVRTGETGAEDVRLGYSFKTQGADDEASKLSGQHVDLREDEIVALLDSGRQVTQLGLRVDDGELDDLVGLTVTDDFTLKGIDWPEVLAEQAMQDCGEDADATTYYRATMLLVSDTLVRLFTKVVDAMGGELSPESDKGDDPLGERFAKIAKALNRWKIERRDGLSPGARAIVRDPLQQTDPAKEFAQLLDDAPDATDEDELI